MEEKIEKTKRGKVYFAENNTSYLPAIAEACNYEIKINTNNSIEQTLNDILEFAPDYLVSNIRFQIYKPQMEALAKIKSLAPNTKIVVTGEPFLTYNNNVTYENPFINYAIMGEAEYTFRDILEGVPDNEILGICYTDENMQAVKNEPRPFIENLDELPFPIRNFNKDLIEFIEVSRGCPHHCFFCMSTPLRGEKARYRSAENVIEELKHCINTYNISDFVFKADNILANRDWLKELCKKIIENKLNIKWSANIIPKGIDNELAEYMKKSGCILCNIGIESGAVSILNNIEKKVTIDDIKNTMSVLKKNKISTNNCFLFGLPWETEETAEETIKLALELDSDEASFYIASPFPGTKFFVYTMINRLSAGDIDFTNAIREPIVKTHNLSKERIIEIQREAIKRYYTQPKYILSSIFSLNFRLFFKIAKILFSRFKNNNIHNKG